MAYSPDGYGEPGATTIIQRSYDDVVHTPRRLSIDGDDPLEGDDGCLLYTSPSPRDISGSRMPSSA